VNAIGVCVEIRSSDDSVFRTGFHANLFGISVAETVAALIIEPLEMTEFQLRNGHSELSNTSWYVSLQTNKQTVRTKMLLRTAQMIRSCRHRL
jgi:hypothetical protein